MIRSVKFLVICATAFFLSVSVYAQQDISKNSPVVVQPGAPGEATKVLPAATRAKLPPVTKADVEFMQGMIHHHAQAVEMVALMKDRTENKELLLLGARISQSQAEEIGFMKRWLEMRGQKTSLPMPEMKDMKMSDHDHGNHQKKTKKMDMKDHGDHQMMMPGMLTPAQMKALADAKGKEFDRLFLTGMIQHHEGALVMVDELFKTPGAGQDAEMFTFATDVDSTQRAEIRLMRTMLSESP